MYSKSIKNRIAEIKVPDNFLQKIPPAATHEEALHLYQICKHYEKDLCMAGLNSTLIEEIPERVAASMETQAKWLAYGSNDFVFLNSQLLE